MVSLFIFFSGNHFLPLFKIKLSSSRTFFHCKRFKSHVIRNSSHASSPQREFLRDRPAAIPVVVSQTYAMMTMMILVMINKMTMMILVMINKMTMMILVMINKMTMMILVMINMMTMLILVVINMMTMMSLVMINIMLMVMVMLMRRRIGMNARAQS